MNYIKKILVTISFFLTVTPHHNSSATTTCQLPKKAVTIFIHGLVGIESIHAFGHLVDIINDHIQGTNYEKSVAIKRAQTSHYTLQAKQDLGLLPIHIDQLPGNGAGATAELLQQMSFLVTPQEEHAEELFFTFGWSGLANRSAQKEAGIELYYALEKLAQSLQEQGFEPIFTVIGYSHGGNIALNLAAACSLDYQEHSFTIDHLVLLATPIICETDYLVQSNLFKKIYSIYSLEDACQTLDILSFKRFGSKKIFTSRADFQLPSNLYQIQIRATDINPKSKHPRPEKIEAPYTQKYLMGTEPYLQDQAPGHFDMWNVAQIWTGKIRKASPLNPLPLVAYMPYILKAAHTYSTVTPDKSIIVDFRPQFGHIVVRVAQDIMLQHTIIPMVGMEKINDIAQSVRHYKPISF